MNRKTILVLVVSIIALAALVAISSYAYLRATATQSSTNTITTLTCLNISFQNNSNTINLQNAYPISDEEGLELTPFNFTVTNNCSSSVLVEINLESLTANTLARDHVKVSLSSDYPTQLSQREEKTKTLSEANYSNNLKSIVLEPNDSKTYDLRLWVDEGTEKSQMNKTYTGRVVAVATAVNGTGLLNAIMNDSLNTIRTPLTIPGQALSLANEALLASTPDDYGTSYYFRGAVGNNYVVFAGMCWRIVRVDGAGNIKLVLYNYNPNNVQNPCATSEDGDTNAFARYNNSYQSEFNTNYNKNTYVGFMYSSNPDSNVFDTAHANDVDSTILTFLKNWYDEKLRSYNDMLADVIWCNDKSIVTDTTYDPWNRGNIQGTGLGTAKTYYKATQRLYPYDSTNSEYNTNNASPSLICPSAGSDGKLSKFTSRDSVNGNAELYSNNKEYKIGLLTVDEIVFAGGNKSSGNTSYYLYNNTSGQTYWSLSPYAFVGRSADVWDVSGGGRLDFGTGGVVYGVRPAVSLKSTVSIASGGAGNQSNPFVVSA